MKRWTSFLLILMVMMTMLPSSFAENEIADPVTAEMISEKTAEEAIEEIPYGILFADEEIDPLSGDETEAVSAAAELRITSHPGDVYAMTGDTIIFSVSASGTGLKYQWQNSPDGANWSATSLGGNKTASLSVPVTATRYKYQWRCVVTDVSGDSRTSNAARIIKPVIEIIAQPSDVCAQPGSTIFLYMTATGVDLKYQWQNSLDGTAWSNSSLDGSKTRVLTLPVTATRARYLWRCVVTDAFGNTKESEPVRIIYAPLKIEAQPVSVIAKPGDTITFSVKADGTDLKYQWENSADGVSWNATSLPGNKTAELTVAVTATRARYQWRCVITDRFGEVKETKAVSITNPVIRIEQQSGDVVAVSGDTIRFSVKATGINLKYQWQNSLNGTDWNKTTLTGYNTPALTVPVTATRAKYQWRCVITDDYGNLVAGSAMRIIIPVITIQEQPSDTVAAGDTVTLTVKAEGTGLKYQWQNSSDGTSWSNSRQTGYNTARLTLPANSTTAKYKWRCVITDTYGTEKITRAAKVTLPSVEITAQPKNVQGKVGDTVTLSVKARGVDLTYQWQYSSDAVTWSNSGIAGAKEAQLNVPVTSARYKYYWRCVVSSGKSVSAETVAVKIINPVIEITAQPVSVTAKSGSTVKFTVSAAGSDLKYRWQNSPDGITWSNSGLTGSNTKTLTLTASSTRAAYLWRCVITNPCGTKVISSAVRLTIAEIRIIEQPRSMTVSIGEEVLLAVKAEGIDLKYQWQYSVNGTAWYKEDRTGAVLRLYADTEISGLYWRCVITDKYGNEKITRSAVINVEEPQENEIYYDVPIYNQHSYKLCWAFCQVMVEDWERGVTRTNDSATQRAIEIAKGVAGPGNEWNKGGWPTNVNFASSDTKVINPTFQQIYDALEDGPVYAYYCKNDNTSAHLVVVTGANLDNGIIYTNNPHGIQDGQTYKEFMDRYSGFSTAGVMSMNYLLIPD